MLNVPPKVVWERNKAERFKLLLQAPACKEILSDIEEKGVQGTQASIDATANLFSEILMSTAALADMSIKKGPKTKNKNKLNTFKKVKPPKWHDLSCSQAFEKVKKPLYYYALIRATPG